MNVYEIAQRFLILSREEQRVIFVSRHSQKSVEFGGKPSDSFDAVGAGRREQRAESGTTPLSLPATRAVVCSGRDGHTAADSPHVADVSRPAATRPSSARAAVP